MLTYLALMSLTHSQPSNVSCSSLHPRCLRLYEISCGLAAPAAAAASDYWVADGDGV